jgi:hypothetical protein
MSSVKGWCRDNYEGKEIKRKERKKERKLKIFLSINRYF